VHCGGQKNHPPKKSQRHIAGSNRFGKTILISATKLSWEEVLSLYRERDEVEKKFDDLKNELEVTPLRIQKVETLKGLLLFSSYH